LLLRGYQTVGELRGRTERLHDFADLEEVESTLQRLAEQGFVTRRAVHEEESGAFSVVRFEVEDSGIGIAAEILPQLFGAFEQTDNSTPPKTAGKP